MSDERDTRDRLERAQVRFRDARQRLDQPLDTLQAEFRQREHEAVVRMTALEERLARSTADAEGARLESMRLKLQTSTKGSLGASARVGALVLLGSTGAVTASVMGPRLASQHLGLMVLMPVIVSSFALFLWDLFRMNASQFVTRTPTAEPPAVVAASKRGPEANPDTHEAPATPLPSERAHSD